MAVGARVTPAGVQSVFNGRVAGVRFGAKPGEVWAVVPGNAWRMAWRDNRVIAHATFDGRPGVHGIAIDPVTHRAVVSSVGRLPGAAGTSRTPGGAPLNGTKAVAHLVSYGDDSLTSNALLSGALGQFMAGSPAIAEKKGADEHRAVVLPLPANDKLVVLDADNGALLRTVPVGVLPIAAVDFGRWQHCVGHGVRRGPSRNLAAAAQCNAAIRAPKPCASMRAASREPGTVERVDRRQGRRHAIASPLVGTHRTCLGSAAPAAVSSPTATSDDVSVVDTRANAVVATISVAPFREPHRPRADCRCAVADSDTLYVTLGGANAVAVFDVTPNSGCRERHRARCRFADSSPQAGIPAASTSARTARRHRRRARCSAWARHRKTPRISTAATSSPYAVGERHRRAERRANSRPTRRAWRRTTDWHLATSAAPSLAPRATASRAPSPNGRVSRGSSRHVVYIIRRTARTTRCSATSARARAILARHVRARRHTQRACPRRAVRAPRSLLRSGGNRPTATTGSPRPTRPTIRCGRCTTAAAIRSKGTIRSRTRRAASSGRRRGEGKTRERVRRVRAGRPATRCRAPRANFSRSIAIAPHEPGVLPRAAAGRCTTRTPHSVARQACSCASIRGGRGGARRRQGGRDPRAPEGVGSRQDDAASRHGDPAERSHVGTSPGWCTPKACVADNDLALGRIVEALSHSSFWKTMAIFVVEDDAQNGVDHIDGHRTVALVASPTRGAASSTAPSTASRAW